MKDLLDQFKRIHQLRMEDAKREKYVGDYGGAKLYDETLNRICETLQKIKKTFPDQVAGCALFDRVEATDWQLRFKRHFTSLFIDRNRDDGSKMIGYDFFNRRDLKIDKIGSDLAYGEGAALAFLVMLNMVYNNFSRKAGEPKPQDLIAMFLELNSIATGMDLKDNVTRSDMRCGGEMQLSWVLEHYDRHKKFGNVEMAYDFGTSVVKILFAKDFDHQQAATALYEDFCHKIKEPEADVESAICELVSALDSYVHICRDGNARISVMIGWFLAITHNVTLPVMTSQCRFDPHMVAEGKEWTKEFCKKPGHPSLPQGLTASRRAQEKNYEYLAAGDPALCFAASVVADFRRAPTDRDVCLSLPLGEKEDFFIVASNIFSMSAKLVDEAGKAVVGPIKGMKAISIKYARMVCAENPDLLQEADLKKRHENIACHVMAKVCQNFDQLTLRDQAFCDLIISKYKKIGFSNAEMTAKFQENVAQYLELKEKAHLASASLVKREVVNVKAINEEQHSLR
jgi:hypothetical protein